MGDVMNWMYARRKAIVAVLGAGLTAASGLGLSGAAAQWVTIALAVVTAAGVYGVPNARPPAPYVPVPGSAAAKMAARAQHRSTS